MKRLRFASRIVLAAVLAVIGSGLASAQGTFQFVTGKEFDSAMPKDFYLEGNAIPTEKRNALLLKTPAGTRALFALIDTAGYSSEVKKKYIGMLISEGDLSICGRAMGVGSFGFGLEKPSPASTESGKFFVYDQAGAKVAECAAEKDAEVKQPRPLQVLPGKDKTARLYLGRYWIAVR